MRIRPGMRRRGQFVYPWAANRPPTRDSLPPLKGLPSSDELERIGKELDLIRQFEDWKLRHAVQQQLAIDERAERWDRHLLYVIRRVLLLAGGGSLIYLLGRADVTPTSVWNAVQSAI